MLLFYIETVSYTHLDVYKRQPPQAGNDVTNQNNDAVGKVVRSAPAPSGGYDVLAEVRLEALAEGTVFWNNLALQIQPLPYSFDAATH